MDSESGAHIGDENLATTEKIIYGEQMKIAESNGVSIRTAWHRYYVLGWSTEKAVSTPIMSRKESGRLGGKKKTGGNEMDLILLKVDDIDEEKDFKIIKIPTVELYLHTKDTQSNHWSLCN